MSSKEENGLNQTVCRHKYEVYVDAELISMFADNVMAEYITVLLGKLRVNFTVY